MKRLHRILLATVFLGLLGGLAFAQRQAGMPALQGVWNPVVGAGAAYQFQGKNQQMGLLMAIVEKVQDDGREGYWIEMQNQLMGQEVIVKYLQVGSEIKRMIMQQGNQEPMEMPVQMMMSMAKNLMPSVADYDVSKNGRLVGRESVTVPAGTFECDHYQSVNEGKTIDIWVSTETPPMGLVKMTGPDISAVLTKTIANYKSKITKTPKKMM